MSRPESLDSSLLERLHKLAEECWRHLFTIHSVAWSTPVGCEALIGPPPKSISIAKSKARPKKKSTNPAPINDSKYLNDRLDAFLDQVEAVNSIVAVSRQFALIDLEPFAPADPIELAGATVMSAHVAGFRFIRVCWDILDQVASGRRLEPTRFITTEDGLLAINRDPIERGDTKRPGIVWNRNDKPQLERMVCAVRCLFRRGRTPADGGIGYWTSRDQPWASDALKTAYRVKDQVELRLNSEFQKAKNLFSAPPAAGSDGDHGTQESINESIWFEHFSGKGLIMIRLLKSKKLIDEAIIRKALAYPPKCRTDDALAMLIKRTNTRLTERHEALGRGMTISHIKRGDKHFLQLKDLA